MYGRLQKRWSASLPTMTLASKAAANSNFCGRITQWSALATRRDTRKRGIVQAFSTAPNSKVFLMQLEICFQQRCASG